MCKCFTDWLFWCCNCCRGSTGRTNTRNLEKLTKRIEKKYGKSTKGEKNLSGTTAMYGTNWETLVHQFPMSPSQIGDSMITTEITIDSEKYKNRDDIYKYALNYNNYEYSRDNLLGKGGFGEVYKVKSIPTGQWFAVKIMHLMKANDLSRTRFDMFKNEVFSLRKNPHKNIITLVDHWMISTLFISFLVMEYAEGGTVEQSLYQAYKKSGNKQGFPEEEAKEYFVQTANAINFVHSNGLIHGDLKLENILITKTKDGKRVIKVTDFGCGRVVIKEDEKVVKMTIAHGTIAYMAPEQLKVYITVNLKREDLLKRRVKSYNPMRADIWSLGVCLYRLLFYKFPYEYNHKNELPSLQKMLQQMKGTNGVNLNKQNMKNLSQDCAHLLQELLTYNKNRRITSKSVIAHKWIKNSPHLDRN